MKFVIETSKIIDYRYYDNAFENPKVTVFEDEVWVKFGESGLTVRFRDVDEAMQVLNNIIRQIEGQMK